MDARDLTEAAGIVTGASSGIGAATARALHQAGARPGPGGAATASRS